MRKTTYLFVLLLLWLTSRVSAQPATVSGKTVKEEQERFSRDLKNAAVDSLVVHSLSYYFDSAVTRIYSSFKADSKLNNLEKDKAARSLVFFMNELNKSLARQQIYPYEIPGVLKDYNDILTALLYHKPIMKLLVPLDAHNSQLLATAFSQYRESSLLDDISVYKRLAASPEFILRFLESTPHFRFADSLVAELASADPLRIVYYLNSDNAGIQDWIRHTKNIYLKQIVTLSEDKYASELVPFVLPIVEEKTNPTEIIGKRTSITGYFQLLVDMLCDSRNSADSTSIFLNALRAGIKEKALSFYVIPINELHSAADAVRFASVKDLRPEDLFYIITSCGEELYTSSYLGLYKRLMEYFKDQSGDILFDMVQFDNFHTFIRLAANYNVLSDFFHSMSGESMTRLLNRFMQGIESDIHSGLERAMDIADCFSALTPEPEIMELMQSELLFNLNRCTSTQQFLGIRLYSILLEILNQVRQKRDELWTTLGNYELLKRDALANKNGEIIQLVLFYGDEDGMTSFNNYLRLFTDNSKWKIVKNEYWVSIRSVRYAQFIIYVNRPLSIKEEMDLKAQDSLITFLHNQLQEPAILVHRGHSYHMDKTLKRLGPSVKLAILGSCGGYNKVISFSVINPDVQVIGSKQTGSQAINDVILTVIDETLVNQNDLLWPEIWKKLEERFSGDEAALHLFHEYFPPSHNLGLFVLKLFKYYNRFARRTG